MWEFSIQRIQTCWWPLGPLLPTSESSASETLSLASPGNSATQSLQLVWLPDSCQAPSKRASSAPAAPGNAQLRAFPPAGGRPQPTSRGRRVAGGGAACTACWPADCHLVCWLPGTGYRRPQMSAWSSVRRLGMSATALFIARVDQRLQDTQGFIAGINL
jgi:hypothetical protein